LDLDIYRKLMASPDWGTARDPKRHDSP